MGRLALEETALMSWSEAFWWCRSQIALKKKYAAFQSARVSQCFEDCCQCGRKKCQIVPQRVLCLVRTRDVLKCPRERELQTDPRPGRRDLSERKISSILLARRCNVLSKEWNVTATLQSLENSVLPFRTRPLLLGLAPTMTKC